MTSAAESVAKLDVRTIVGGGVKLGLLTVIGVVTFSVLSRFMEDTPETIAQLVLIIIGGIVLSYFPAITIRPKDVDSIAWAALVGLLGALVFTVVDTAVLRPLGVYDWTWDQIGGGSGFWYIPVWWMGATVLAWLGAWGFSLPERAGRTNMATLSGQTVAISIILFVLLGFVFGPFTAAMMALGFTLALAVQILLASVLTRK